MHTIFLWVGVAVGVAVAVAEEEVGEGLREEVGEGVGEGVGVEVSDQALAWVDNHAHEFSGKWDIPLMRFGPPTTMFPLNFCH